MDENLKTDLQAIVQLIETLPEKYQEKCFELLLQDFLRRRAQGVLKPAESKVPPAIGGEEGQAGPGEKAMGGIKEEKLHIRFKAFMKRYGIPPDHLGGIFFMENDHIEPIYQLKTTKVAEAQIQHTLLLAVRQAIQSGQFECPREAVRELCKEKLCYDSANFAAHFRKKRALFKDISGEGPLDLSEEGTAQAAELIRSLVA